MLYHFIIEQIAIYNACFEREFILLDPATVNKFLAVSFLMRCSVKKLHISYLQHNFFFFFFFLNFNCMSFSNVV